MVRLPRGPGSRSSPNRRCCRLVMRIGAMMSTSSATAPRSSRAPARLGAPIPLTSSHKTVGRSSRSSIRSGSSNARSRSRARSLMPMRGGDTLHRMDDKRATRAACSASAAGPGFSGSGMTWWRAMLRATVAKCSACAVQVPPRRSRTYSSALATRAGSTTSARPCKAAGSTPARTMADTSRCTCPRRSRTVTGRSGRKSCPSVRSVPARRSSQASMSASSDAGSRPGSTP